MRLVATSDTHKPVDVDKIPDGDVFVHAGDLCNTGYIEDFYMNLEWLAALPHKKKYFIPGNHDFHLCVYPGPALQELRSAGVTVLGFPGNSTYYTSELPNGMTIGGFPLVDGLQERWAFGMKTYKDFGVDRPYDIFRSLVFSCDIVVGHAPIYGFKDVSKRDTPHKNVGDEKMLQEIIYAKRSSAYGVNPKMKHYIHGHIHEDKGSMLASVENYEFMVHNVSMCDRAHRHTGKPLVLDL